MKRFSENPIIQYSNTPLIRLLLLVALSLAATLRAAPTRPNLVYIMADDLGIGDVACFGGERCLLETPGFDRIAREGMLFTDAHPAASVCVPSRVAIMTGRYAWRFDKPRPSGPWGFLNPQLPAGQSTLGTMLRSAGYRTGYVGKWHLGTKMATTDGENQGPENVDYTKPLAVGPVQFGFDDSFILPGSLDMYPYVFARNNQWVGKVNAQKGWSAFNRVGPAEENFEDWKVIDTFSSEAEAFIAKQAAAAKDGKPFFLYLALTSPHTPTSPRPAFQGKSAIGPYGDFVMETDDCVNRILKALDEHGLAENTLVIATSDHGPAPYAGPKLEATYGQIHEMEKMGHYPAGIYRGYKFSVYEGGLRVPFVARWPGVVKAGTRCDRLVGLQDVMATFGEIAGHAFADDEAPDSISFLPLLKDAGAAPPRDTMILESTQNFVVRHENWKLALCPGSGCKAAFGNLPKPEDAWREAIEEFGSTVPADADLRHAPFVQLFDVAADPGESDNLASGNPERIDTLVAILEDAIARGRTTPGPKLANDRPRIPFLPRAPQ